jgi:hypothetical protein
MTQSWVGLKVPRSRQRALKSSYESDRRLACTRGSIAHSHALAAGPALVVRTGPMHKAADGLRTEVQRENSPSAEWSSMRHAGHCEPLTCAIQPDEITTHHLGAGRGTMHAAAQSRRLKRVCGRRRTWLRAAQSAPRHVQGFHAEAVMSSCCASRARWWGPSEFRAPSGEGVQWSADPAVQQLRLLQ